jgi:hypothetical protein
MIMKRKRNKSGYALVQPHNGQPKIRKDLSYLNEMPQMGRYEGVKAGVPPPNKKAGKDEENTMADES